MLDIDVWGNDRRERAPLTEEDVEQIRTRFGVAWSVYWRDQARQPPYPSRSWLPLQQRGHVCLFLAEASPPEAGAMIEHLRGLQQTARMHRYPTDLGLAVHSTSPDDRFPGLAGLWVILRAWEKPR